MLRGAVLSTRPALRFSLRVVCPSSRRPPVRLPSVHSTRPFSLASLFVRPNPKSIPSPQVVALITRLEAEANVSPHDVDKQLALFRALVDTRMPSSYELVVARWDRMCEFVRLPFFLISLCSYRSGFCFASPPLGRRFSTLPWVSRQSRSGERRKHCSREKGHSHGCPSSAGRIDPRGDSRGDPGDDRLAGVTRKSTTQRDAESDPGADSPSETDRSPVYRNYVPSRFFKIAGYSQRRKRKPHSSIHHRTFVYMLQALSGDLIINLGKGAWVPKTIRFVCYLLAGSFCASMCSTVPSCFNLVTSFPRRALRLFRKHWLHESRPSTVRIRATRRQNVQV